jgi:hypothetical protein
MGIKHSKGVFDIMKIELGSAIEVVPPKQESLQKDVANASGVFALKSNRVVFLVMML